ncbi:type II secretion system protein GspG [bacterium]|nr:type II secretion system protein GspG [bacterium]
MLRHSTQTGFNLMELLVVVGIIVILASVGFIYGPTQITKAKLAAEKANITELATAIEMFRQDTGRYPARGQLVAQLSDPKAAADVNWRGPYYTPTGKRDPRNITGVALDLETGQPLSLLAEQIADEWGTALYYIPKRDYPSVGVLQETPFAGSETLFGGSIYVNSNSFVLISAGPDRRLRMKEGRPAPLVYGDGRDNDGDGATDEFQVKGRGTGPEFWPEDDIVNY